MRTPEDFLRDEIKQLKRQQEADKAYIKALEEESRLAHELIKALREQLNLEKSAA